MPLNVSLLSHASQTLSEQDPFAFDLIDISSSPFHFFFSLSLPLGVLDAVLIYALYSRIGGEPSGSMARFAQGCTPHLREGPPYSGEPIQGWPTGYPDASH